MLLTFTVSILIALGAGLIGSVSTMKEIPTWYAGLAKPSFSPPNWVFGPVWTTLYVLMGIAAALAYEAGIERQEVQLALIAYAIQLMLNAAWSYIFFGRHRLWLAFYELVLMWLAIALTAALFYRIDPLAAYLLAPYLAWVTFAGFLNWTLAKLNRA